jgi:hypothetical protein
MTTRRVFVDETKHHSPAVLRASLRELLLPNQRFLHMRNERDGRRRQIAATIAGAGVRARLIEFTRAEICRDSVRYEH